MLKICHEKTNSQPIVTNSQQVSFLKIIILNLNYPQNFILMSCQKSVVLFFFSILVFSCTGKKIDPDNIYRFKSYISYTTSGIISTHAPFQIHLTKPLDQWNTGDEVPDKILSTHPKVEGSFFLKNRSTLEFIPESPLKADTEYSVTIQLDKLFDDVAEDRKTYTFHCQTIKPSFKVSLFNLQSYNKDWQFIDGSVSSADVISLKDAKKIIEATQKGKDISIVWDESYQNSKNFDFRLDSIKRYDNDDKILVSWDGKSIDSDIQNQESFVIPGKDNFEVTKIDIVNGSQQSISINFSDPLKKNQNFKGLVSVQNVQRPKFVVDGNVLKVFPDKTLTGNLAVDVFQGIKSKDGYKLKKGTSTTLSFAELKPQVRLLTSGSVLPNSNNLKFNFEAVNLKSVDLRIIKIFENNVMQFLQNNNLDGAYQLRRVGRRIAKEKITLIPDESQNTKMWKAYSIDLSSMFDADPGAIYRVEIDFDKEDALLDCQLREKEQNDEDLYYDNDLTEEEKEELYWDNKLYDYKRYRYTWRERNNPCSDSYYRNKGIAQNLVASNLGLIVKRGNNKNYFFAVTDILTTQPIPNAKITVYNYQQQEFDHISTNEDGIAIYESDADIAFVIASQGENTSYVKLTDGNSLSLSKFDVSGVRTQKGIKGFLYTERGVWRPGDSIYLNFILNDRDNKLPKGHPVKLEVTDPNGKLVHKKVIADHTGQFYSFPFATTEESNTGVYNAKVSVGGAKFSKNLKVETVKPNRLKINLDFDDEIFSYGKPLKGKLQLNWLHGAPARGLRAEISAKVFNTQTKFDAFPNYVFNDPTRDYYTDEIQVFDQKVNSDGVAIIKSPLNTGKNAPGMLRVSFLVKAFETGGDFSIDAFSKKYAPYDSFVGLQSPMEDSYGSYPTNSNHTFDVATVTAEGKPISRKNLEVKVFKIRWRWWWNSGKDNLSTYNSDTYHQPYKSIRISTDAKGRGNFKLNIPKAHRGRYLIRVIDPVSKHATGRTLYFYDNWWENISSGDKEAAKMLIFNSDKKTYQVGETAKITFPSANIGKALISMENGSEVIQHKWVDTKKGTTIVDIPITPEMTPNFFVNISLLQPHAKVQNDLPIRLYGTIPIMVEDPSKRLEPIIDMAESVEPEKEFTVKVSERNKKPMTYTLAIVEEGLLDLTRFKTPNPYGTFYAREALGVRTWDIFDDVIGAYTGSIDQVFAIGGDGTSASATNRKANRFKAVVKHLGPFILKSGENKEHKIKLPNYIGAVRTMVVAGNSHMEAYGNVDKSVKVKKPLMVLASLPRKLSPGEKVTLPVTVFATEKNIKNVDVEVELSDGIKVIGSNKAQLTFTKTGEQMAYFTLDVLKANGFNTVKVTAKSGSQEAKYNVEIDVVNPNPMTSKVTSRVLEANQNTSLDFSTFGVNGSNSAVVQISSVPPIDFNRRLEYLIRYPHGCVEQTTSSVFPQLFMAELFELSTEKKLEIEDNIKKGIIRLGNFQTTSGGLTYWMGESYTSDWGTSYAGHFMMEAEKKGYVLPFSFKNNWVRFQKDKARNWKPRNKGYSGDIEQSYRLYTLALSGNADLGAMNRLREFDGLSNSAKWRLAAAYALIGQKQASKELANTSSLQFNDDYYRYSYGSSTRNKAMALETMLLLDDNRSYELAKSVAKDLSGKSWYSTQTTAYALLSMGKLMIKNGGKAIKVEYVFKGEKDVMTTNKTFMDTKFELSKGNYKIDLSNKENNAVYVSLINKGKLPLGDELVESRGLTATISYSLANGTPLDVNQLEQGQEFVATVTVRNLGYQFVEDIALTQIFPSGWEIVNTRFTDYGGGTTSKARYTDIRDDRVNFYFDLSGRGSRGDEKQFKVLLNASYLGTYYLPGIQSEAMYDNDYLVRGKGKWIKVVK